MEQLHEQVVRMRREVEQLKEVSQIPSQVGHIVLFFRILKLTWLNWRSAD